MIVILALSNQASAQFGFCDSPSDKSIFDKVGESITSIKSYVQSNTVYSKPASIPPVSIHPHQFEEPEQLQKSNLNIDDILNEMEQNQDYIAESIQKTDVEFGAKLNSLKGGSYGTSEINNSQLGSFKGRREKIENVTIGSLADSISADAPCGMPPFAASENNRREWYEEAANNTQSSVYFQTDQELIFELEGIQEKCEAFKAQVTAYLPALNHSIDAARRLSSHNHLPISCKSANSASTVTMCGAVERVYAMKAVAYLCHHKCGLNNP